MCPSCGHLAIVHDSVGCPEPDCICIIPGAVNALDNPARIPGARIQEEPWTVFRMLTAISPLTHDQRQWIGDYLSRPGKREKMKRIALSHLLLGIALFTVGLILLLVPDTSFVHLLLVVGSGVIIWGAVGLHRIRKFSKYPLHPN
jgi:hypothetical protein